MRGRDKLLKDENPTSQKRYHFREQIRRKQIDNMFRICRHQVSQISLEQALLKCKQIFVQLNTILKTDHTNLFSNNKLSILLKQLREINSSHCIPSIFGNHHHINILLQLQNSRQLNPTDEIAVYQIFLNISAYEGQELKNKIKINNGNGNYYMQSNLELASLTLKQNLNSNHGGLISLTIQIMGNFLSRDQSSRTVYYLITKIGIFTILLKLLLDRKQIYNRPEVRHNFHWFANRLISTAIRYKFIQIDIDCKNFIKCFYEQLVNLFHKNQDKYQANEKNTEKQQGEISLNEFLVYLKTLLRTNQIEQDVQLYREIERFFSPYNAFYLDFLGTLMTRTLYSLPKTQLQNLTIKLLEQPDGPLADNILRNIGNSLANDGTHWKVVLDYFIFYAQNQLPPFTPYRNPNSIQNERYHINYARYGQFSYFMFFLHNVKTQQSMVLLMHALICGQGGLGVFQSDIQYFCESELMRKKLSDLGVQIEVIQ